MSLRALGTLAMEYLVCAVALFLPAGRLDWPAGWILLVLMLGFSLAVSRLMARNNPDLLKERTKVFQADQQAWDKVFVIVNTVLVGAYLILMPLDAVRFQWSGTAVWLQGAGGVGVLLALSILYLTFKENAYLSAVVRIQEDRGQTLVSTGPYRYVRHPMYAGILILFPAAALLLGSWYGLALALVVDLMFVIRTALEERTLRASLTGYDDYASKVKYRLIPHVW